MIRARRFVVLCAAVAAAIGCSPTAIDVVEPMARPPAADRIAVRNATSTDLTVVVNGAPVTLVVAGTRDVVSLLGRAGPPYHIEVRSPAGTTAMSFDISVQDHREVAGGQTSSGSGAATDCGWVELAYGTDVFQPADPMAAMPTPGGFCP